jgi:hypothetical protein
MSTTHKDPLILTVGQIATIWILSDIAYYIVLPVVGVNLNYNAQPISIALYYLLWVCITLLALSPIFRSWRPFVDGRGTYMMLATMVTVVVVFLAYILPQFEPIVWAEAWTPPSELLFATSWYFLPKSIEILLQQLLVAALTLAFAARGFSVRTTALWCALLFGGGHLLLVFGGAPLGYIVRFATAATMAGFAFPYLLLRTENGFAYSYMLHWLYYAATIVLIHTISPYAT